MHTSQYYKVVTEIYVLLNYVGMELWFIALYNIKIYLEIGNLAYSQSELFYLVSFLFIYIITTITILSILYRQYTKTK